MRILLVYEKATGQQVSIAKSAITFGAKVPEEVKTMINGVTGIQKEGG